MINETVNDWGGLAKLRTGWLDGDGEAPNPKGIKWLEKHAIEHFDGSLNPHIYPTPEGGVQFEWDFGLYRPTLEIDLENHTGDWHCMNIKTDETKERRLNLADPHCWGWLVTELHYLQEKPVYKRRGNDEHRQTHQK